MSTWSSWFSLIPSGRKFMNTDLFPYAENQPSVSRLKMDGGTDTSSCLRTLVRSNGLPASYAAVNLCMTWRYDPSLLLSTFFRISSTLTALYSAWNVCGLFFLILLWNLTLALKLAVEVMSALPIQLHIFSYRNQNEKLHPVKLFLQENWLLLILETTRRDNCSNCWRHWERPIYRRLQSL